MRAPAGKVTIHERKMVRTTVKLSAPIPRAKPTPNTAPTKVCVVEIGKPVPDAKTTAWCELSNIFTNSCHDSTTIH